MTQLRHLHALPPPPPAPENPQTRFSTPLEVAATLRISKSAVYRMLRDGVLPAYRFGRSYRIPTQAVWAYIDGSKIDWNNVDRASAL